MSDVIQIFSRFVHCNRKNGKRSNDTKLYKTPFRTSRSYAAQSLILRGLCCGNFHQDSSYEFETPGKGCVAKKWPRVPIDPFFISEFIPLKITLKLL